MSKYIAIPFLLICLFAKNSFAIDQAELLANFNFAPKDVFSAVSWKPASKTAEQKPDFFLSAEFEDRGRELVKVDGDTGEVTLLRDIEVGINGSVPLSFTVVGDTLFFTAENTEFGRELWKTDGTSTGTVLVQDINPGATSTAFGQFIAFQNGTKIAFAATSPGLGSELFVSNGLSSGTIVYDIYDTPTFGSTPSQFFLHKQNQLVFQCTTASASNALCEFTDGANPTILKPGVSLAYGFEKLNATQFVFGALDLTAGYEVFVSDGTEIGTSMVTDLNVGAFSSNPNNFTLFNGEVYFSARASGVNVGESLWRTNGTEVGTMMVQDLNLDNDNGEFSNFQVINNSMLFFAIQDATGLELWKSTGGTASLLRDLTAGIEGSDLTSLTPVYEDQNQGIFIFNHTSGLGQEIWVTDGTSLGTKILKDIWTGSEGSEPVIFHDEVNSNSFFIAKSPSTLDLYTTDGTEAGTTASVSLAFGADRESNPVGLALITDDLLFVNARTQRFGYEPFAVNLLTNESILLKDIYQGKENSNPSVVGRVGSRLLFTADDNLNGQELWVTDGTVDGTTLLKDINVGPDSATISKGVALGNSVIFPAGDAVNGIELWISDGTTEGTVLLKDINTGVGSSQPFFSFAVLGNKVVFDAAESTNDRELWITDGTTVGTTLLKDINVGSNGSYPSYLYAASSGVYFYADNGADGVELWKTDGTSVGTILVKNIEPGSDSSEPIGFIEYQGNVYFAATTSSDGRELWRTDGSNSGTLQVLDLASGSNDGLGYEPSLAILDDALYFVGNSDITGDELYKTLGTAGTTTLVKDIVPGISDSQAEYLTVGGDKIYFSATTEATGKELWQTDGTEAGTSQVADIYQGPTSSNPFIFLADNRAVYFSANNNRIGEELWKVVFDECPSDLNKKEPAACGCGVIEQDLNSNGVLDCFIEADFEAYITDAQANSKKIKFNQQKNKKQIKKLNSAIKKFRTSVKLVLSEATVTAPSLPSLDTKKGKRIRKQLKVNLRTFSQDPTKETRKPVNKSLANLKAL